MPIEIRELQITTTISDTPSQTGNASKLPVNTDDIIAQCVEQVLDILKQKEER